MAGGRVRRALALLGAPALLALLTGDARAIEALDGKLEAHGFVETQIRALDRNFSEQLDLAQWYNIFNAEVEYDIAPDGFGPFDLVSAFVRVEFRYDCVYTRGCGMVRAADTYGNRAAHLPDRLSNAVDPDRAGVLPPPPGVRPTPRHPFPVPNRFSPFRGPSFVDLNDQPIPDPIIESSGFPGFDTLFRQDGADAVPNTGDEPAAHALGPVLDHRFALLKIRDQGAGGTQILGPWLPRNDIVSSGALRAVANPFRGRFTPTGAERFHERDVRAEQIDLAGFDRAVARGQIDPLDPALLAVVDDPGFRGTGFPISQFFPRRGNDFIDPTPGSVRNLIPFPEELFGGDWTRILPCQEPSRNPMSIAQAQITGQEDSRFCIPDGAFVDPADPSQGGTGTNLRILGGAAELPMRPAPDIGNLAGNPGLERAQGLYYPSVGLREERASNRLDPLDLNFSQSERALNFGQSQQQTRVLKEAYLDLELFDSRLWARIGRQNIVWGKTELFRTTDQFNPVDFALSSLPNLEESRIPLWSARFVYSFYEVWQFEDLRFEFAFNFDEFQPTDVGACGEPYNIDFVCAALGFGSVAHGTLGVGVVGIDRPDAPWDDLSKLEFGERIEGRWGRFSFALVHFSGYDDFPYVDSVFSYERNVDPWTGRPRVARSTGPCGGGFATTFEGDTPAGRNAMQIFGIGTDRDCLKPGGAAGFTGENRFRGAPDVDGDGLPDPEFVVDLDGDFIRSDCDLDGDGTADDCDGDGAPDVDVYGFGRLADASPQNAVENHHANQQIFATICSATVSIAAGLDPRACAFNIFGSDVFLRSFLPIVFSQTVAALSAGEINIGLSNFYRTLQGNQVGQSFTYQPTLPIRNLNRDVGDGVNTYVEPEGGPEVFNPGRFTQDDDDFLSPDSTLTPAQRALIGCGPFYGTRCDTARRQEDGGVLVFGAGGAIDLLNTEASALVQSWPGVEGTGRVGLNGYSGGLWTTTDRALTQPGTSGFLRPLGDGSGRLVSRSFEGGPTCTRYVGGEIVVLPGCRGIATPDDFARAGRDRSAPALTLTPPAAGTIRVNNPGILGMVFQVGFDPRVDGCPVEMTLVSGTLRTNRGRLIVEATDTNGDPVDLSDCRPSTTRVGSNAAQALVNAARTVYHPLAGCFDDPTGADDRVLCDPVARNGGIDGRGFDDEFLAGTASIFRSEMAAYSWNILMLLVITSCGEEERDPATGNFRALEDPECFDGAGTNAFRSDWCGFAAPQFCRNVKAFFNLAGVQAPVLRAAGNGRFGRRTFVWHGGQEVAIRYDRRHVFGFSVDFAEDVSKTSWGVEFTWIPNGRFFDRSEFDNITRQDVYNLTISVDRPTFINFLNANRTFFFNTQWFFQYQDGWRKSFNNNGPLNVLFTFAAFTGYYQDRLLPNFVTVYDFKSRSGAILPSMTYRFTEVFSVDWGFLFFFGRTQLREMAVNPIQPPANRAPPRAFVDPVDNVLSSIRKRDEVFLRLRWTF